MAAAPHIADYDKPEDGEDKRDDQGAGSASSHLLISQNKRDQHEDCGNKAKEYPLPDGIAGDLREGRETLETC